MKQNKNKKVNPKLNLNTSFIFAEEKQEISEVIGLIFKDYIESLKNKE